MPRVFPRTRKGYLGAGYLVHQPTIGYPLVSFASTLTYVLAFSGLVYWAQRIMPEVQ